MSRRIIRHQGLELLIAAGEGIHQSQRRLFREGFGIEPVECYGSVELGVMAHEKPDRDGLHPTEEQTHFEFLDENEEAVAPGEPDRLVATALTRTLMSVIRYGQGDPAVFATRRTRDDVTQQRLTRIIGRDTRWDTRFLQGNQQIRRDCTVPCGAMNARIMNVVDASFFDSIPEELQRGFQSAFPPEVSFQINRVDHLEPDPSGKLRMLISEVEA